MNKEQLIELGLTEEQAGKVVDGFKSFIPKARFDEVNDAKKKLERDVADRESQLEEIKKNAGASDELRKQIEILQSENKSAKENYEASLKDLTLTNAIKSALSGKAHDEALVSGLFDKSKLVIDGDKVVGLEEQLKGLQESKQFLFKSDEKPQGGFQPRIGTGGAPQGQNQPAPDQLAAIFGNTK